MLAECLRFASSPGKILQGLHFGGARERRMDTDALPLLSPFPRCPSMNSLQLGLLAAGCLLAGWWLVMRIRKALGVWRLRYYAFPRKWLKYLHESVPLYHRLPWELRSEFQDRVLSFIDGKQFRYGGTLEEVSEEQRVIIAAQACFLLLNRENASCFGEILGVTLSEGIVPQKAMEVATPTRPSLLWDAKRRTVLDPQDRGPGTVPAILRKLGVEPAGAPGDPDLRLTPWGRVLAGELHDHLGFAASGAWMERYGASGDPADFYAAATEAFFMHPQVLQKTDRGLYDSLRQFYKVDPVRWKVLTH